MARIARAAAGLTCQSTIGTTGAQRNCLWQSRPTLACPSSRSRSILVTRASEGPNGVDGLASKAAKAAEPLLAKTTPKTTNENMLPNVNNNTAKLTTNTGAPVVSNKFSLTVGRRGPVLLEDYHLTEKLAQFDREKTPERVVHARGMTAKGYFECTADVAGVTMADFLGSKGKKTQVAARFSTVTHERGSPESLRDVRGFSVKFYTQEGNWDFVGNNIPVFWIRDGMAFPDLVHALRPNPKTHIQEGWRVLDFLAGHPEGINNLLWVWDDTGIPASWRHLEGYSINTFTLINDQGEEQFVRFHFQPSIGAKFLTNEEAKEVGENNMRHSHATHDLYNAIANGDYPEWTFGWQTMDKATAERDDLGFDPLDCTKAWPEGDFPVQIVGRMVLDTNIANFHTESEQIAFNPGITVPGIGLSNDRLLQSRAFSYSDTQRYRIGANYQQLPINIPRCPFHNNHNDGAQQWGWKDEEVNYFPSVVQHEDEYEQDDKVNWTHDVVSGARTKEDFVPYTDGGADEFRQPGERYREVIKPDSARKERFQTNIVSWMTDPKCPQKLRDIWYGYLSRVDEDLGAEIKQTVESQVSGKSGSLQAAGTTKA